MTFPTPATGERLPSDAILRSTLVVVCSYNERDTLPRLIQQIRASSSKHSPVSTIDILVIDDSSPDGTASLIQELQETDQHLHLVVRPGKQGLGSAILAGLQWGIDRNYQWIVNLDADLSHDPNEIPSMLIACEKSLTDKQVVDVAIGSRYVHGGRMENCSWRRHLVSRCANFLVRYSLWIMPTDCSSAFRIYRAEGLARIDLKSIQCHGYGMLEEILVQLIWRGATVREFPIVYTEREFGDSKISIREAIGTLATIIRLFSQRFAWRAASKPPQ